MAERAQIAQRCQIGVEATHGTAVAANKRLAALMIDPSPAGDVKMYRPSGSYFPTAAATGKLYTTASLKGVATYNEIIYPLASALCTPVTTVPVGGTLSHQHVFAPAPEGGDAYKTFTVEYGDAENASRFAYGAVTDFSLAWSRDEVSVSGNMLGQAMEANAGLTASPTQLDLIPILGNDVSVYLDPDSADLGVTKLTRQYGGSFDLSGRRKDSWAVDRANPSFAALVDTEPKVEVKFRMMKDAVSDALYNTLDDNATRFMRIEAIGPNIEASVDHSFVLDVAVKLSAVPKLTTSDEVYAYEFTAHAVTDATWGKAFSVTVINKLATL